ncbi:hypothetical protein M1394_00520 [Candidatus Marsarchaeota archaeon]|nr:hypothetical protein [Candidatus Marsarchaeota archaeon]
MALQKSVEKWKSKNWFDVYAPKIFGDIVIGEIPAADEKKILGRRIKVSLSWITHKPEHSFLVIGLKVNDSKGNVAHTTINYLEQTYSYVHSLVKRHGSVIYTIDNVRDKDNNNLVVKLILVSRGKITTTKKTAIRKEISSLLKELVAGMSKEDLITSIIENKLQNESRNKIKNIAFINKLEVKKIEFETKGNSS